MRYTPLLNIFRAQDDFKNILKTQELLSPILIQDCLASIHWFDPLLTTPSCPDDDWVKPFRFYCYVLTNVSFCKIHFQVYSSVQQSNRYLYIF